jgi:hypothetical protein
MTLSCRRRRLHHNTARSFLVLHSCRMLRPSDPHLDLWYVFKSTTMKLLIMQSSPFSGHFLPLDLNIFCPRSSLQMTGNFAPIQTSKSLIILCILIFLESKWDEKKFWIRWKQTFPQFNLLLVFNLCNSHLLVSLSNKSMSLWYCNDTPMIACNDAHAHAAGMPDSAGRWACHY